MNSAMEENQIEKFINTNTNVDPCLDPLDKNHGI